MTTKRYPYEPDYRVHPGETLREVAVWRLAEQIGVRGDYLVDIADGRIPITQGIAEALATVEDGIDATFWMNLQRNYYDDGARIARKRDTRRRMWRWIAASSLLIVAAGMALLDIF